MPVDRRRAQVVVLGEGPVLEAQQPSAARRQRLAGNQECGGGVTERQAGRQIRNILE